MSCSASRRRASTRRRSRRAGPPCRRGAARSAGRTRRASRRRASRACRRSGRARRSWYCCTAPSAWTPIGRPTVKSSFFAVASSITTSFVPGQPPSTSVSGLKGGSPSAMLKPRLGALPTIALPSLLMDRRLAATPPSACCTSVEPADLREQGLVERRRLAAAAVGGLERGLARDHGVRALYDLVEDRVERLLDRVREHVGAADHRDAQHDRDRGQSGSQLASEQALKREHDHAVVIASIAARISGCVERGSSLTILPSARKSMRSAIAAARGSCVTITVVWPYSSTECLKQVEDLAARLRVEVAGRLVGEDDRRARDERARDRDALLLSAGELGRAVLAPVGEADVVDQRARRTPGRASRRRS